MTDDNKKSLITIDQFNLNDIELLKQLIFHIEANVLGKLLNIKRFFDHNNLIFDLISVENDKLGLNYYNRISIEIMQIRTIFNRKKDEKRLTNIVINNDQKQYGEYIRESNRLEVKLRLLNDMTDKVNVILKKELIRTIEKRLKFQKKDYYQDKFRMINRYINIFRSHYFDIDYIIKPKYSHPSKHHKDYFCAASVFGLTSDEYRDLSENQQMIKIHDSSRRYDCLGSKDSIEAFIDKCFDTAYPRILKKNPVLWCSCPCKKINDNTCGLTFNLELLIDNCNLTDKFKFKIINKKESLFKSLYNVDIYIQCPKTDCPNNSGFPVINILNDLLNGQLNHHINPIHKCNICNTVWCSKCKKIHPGKLCLEEDDEDYGLNIKKCPNCKVLTEREGGCFHIKCIKCDVHWCWDCNYFTLQSNAYKHECINGNWMEINR